MASERTYQLAVHAWNTYHDTVAIQSNTGLAIAFFPVPFIRNRGDNTWRYVLQVVNQLVESHAPHIGVIKNLEGEVLDSEAAPLSGTYLYEQTGCTLPLKFSRGPEYFTAVGAANTEGSSTRARSSRSTVNNQSSFLLNLIARDTFRPDIYQALLNIPASLPPPLFEVQFGLLLRKELHHAWDRLDFSFFVKDDDIFNLRPVIAGLPMLFGESVSQLSAPLLQMNPLSRFTVECFAHLPGVLVVDTQLLCILSYRKGRIAASYKLS
ncbi:hypothetical protein I308_106720 [Cryptococcus tetragattii IND107]|uniref:HNH nuclease domain-containing protein n=1 Tax=Cryptococcus tetragattii IND107 TaxID=1296105 RepID=A0ABR3BK71_9TREE